MFSTLSERLQNTINALRGQARISESNIADSIREVRMALLEADVSLSVVKSFIDEVKQRALGQEVLKSLTPAQAFIDVVHQELVRLMGDAKQNLNLATTPPAVILLVGLQGTGKTTTSAKLAYWLKTQKKKVLLASADTYRPAAITQLQMLSKQISVDCVDSATNATPPTIAIEALRQAQRGFYDVLIVDSAGRLAVDEKMMNEINILHTTLRPIETLFVVDAMQGQDAVNTAKAFGDALPITGIVLTKLDGDARGGVALSVRQITGKPIKFTGVSEKMSGLDIFYPERMVSRILGMGDVLGLIEEAHKKIDLEESKKLSAKIKTGQLFDLNDFKVQMTQMRKMGGVDSLMDKLPDTMRRAGQVMNSADADIAMRRVEGIINSMTAQERNHPEIIKASRKRRIAKGAGVQVQDVNKMLKQFEETQKMMKMLSQGGFSKMMRNVASRLGGKTHGLH